MAYTKATLVQNIRWMLGDRPFTDVLTGAYTAAQVTYTVGDATKYDVGDRIEFISDGDTTVLTAASGTTLTTVAALLGYDGSTNASHSSGAAFVVKPAFSYKQIVEAVEQTIQELWPYAWKKVTETITPSTTSPWYDMTSTATTVQDLMSVTQVSGSGTGARPKWYNGGKGSYPAQLVRDVPTTIAASGVALYVPYLWDTTNSIFANGRAKITTTVSSGDYSDLTAGSMVDCIIYGACARLVENSEIPRVDGSDVTMGDATVTPGLRLRSAAYFHERFMQKREMIKRELEVTIPRARKER